MTQEAYTTQQDISIELFEIIWEHCQRTNKDFYKVYQLIGYVAKELGFIGKPMAGTGFALIARDVLRIWEGVS